MSRAIDHPMGEGAVEGGGAKNLGELAVSISPEVAAVLDHALSGGDISAEDAVILFDS